MSPPLINRCAGLFGWEWAQWRAGSFPEGHVSISRGSAGRMKRMLNALGSGTVMLEAKDGAWRKLGEDEVMHD